MMTIISIGKIYKNRPQILGAVLLHRKVRFDDK